jgi:hypothetical protein
LAACETLNVGTYIPEPKRKKRNWKDKPESWQQSTQANGRRVRGARSKRLQRLRSEYVERSFAHVCETGGGRRTWLRGLEKVHKRYLVQVPEQAVGNQAVFSPSGYAVAWRYYGKVASVISPVGTVVGSIDLTGEVARNEGERKNLIIHSAAIDEQRGLWFIGTSHGLAVGGMDRQSRQPLMEVHRVKSLGTATPLAIGSFLGRIIFAAEFDGSGGEGCIFLEKGFGVGPTDPSRFADHVTFAVTSWAAAMGRPTSAAIVGPDIVWVALTASAGAFRLSSLPASR